MFREGRSSWGRRYGLDEKLRRTQLKGIRAVHIWSGDLLAGLAVSELGVLHDVHGVHAIFYFPKDCTFAIHSFLAVR